MNVSDDTARAALVAFDDQSMQQNDARYVCMRAALEWYEKNRATAERASDEGAVAWEYRDFYEGEGWGPWRYCTKVEADMIRGKSTRQVRDLYAHPPQATVRPVREVSGLDAQALLDELRDSGFHMEAVYDSLRKVFPNGVVDQENGA